MHEPRFKWGMGAGYAISPTGADHCHNIHDSVYTRGIPGATKALGIYQPLPAQELGPAKVRLLAYGSLWQHVLNCVGFCQFVPLSPDQMAGLIGSVTGWNTTVWELMKAGERCIAMARAFNIREGLTKGDDYLPRRFFTPFTSGPLKGVGLDEGKMRQAIDTYYAMVGWDKKGTPTPAKLQELGIEWVAEALE